MLGKPLAPLYHRIRSSATPSRNLLNPISSQATKNDARSLDCLTGHRSARRQPFQRFPVLLTTRDLRSNSGHAPDLTYIAYQCK
jgi:hypothetical protein